jgi:hypothetical protein
LISVSRFVRARDKYTVAPPPYLCRYPTRGASSDILGGASELAFALLSPAMPKSTPEQTFTKLYNLATDPATPEHERECAKRNMAAWLKRHGKTERDYPAIFAKAAVDDDAQRPPPPSTDPRDDAPHPFDDPRFTPAGLVEGIAAKYLTMHPHVAVIFALWIVFTHVHTRFGVAPRIALTSEGPDSGKTTALEIARRLVLRPNPETLGTGAAIEDFLSQGPCTVLLDELDHVDAGARRRLQQVWNMGHKRGARTSSMRAGRRKLINIYAPALAAGIGGFLAPTQRSRTFMLEMRPYDEATKPEREYSDDDVEDLNAVYSFLHHWAGEVKLNLKPEMPPGVLRRDADNARALLAIADKCGLEWGRRAREALTFLLAKEKSECPEITMIRHGLVIFEALGLEQIGSVRFNKELRRLDLPDARWTRYRGPSGSDYARPIEMYEQATLLRKVGIHSTTCWPDGGRAPGASFRGYKLVQFEEAQRKYSVAAPDEAEVGRARLRLVKPQPD